MSVLRAGRETTSYTSPLKRLAHYRILLRRRVRCLTESVPFVVHTGSKDLSMARQTVENSSDHRIPGVNRDESPLLWD
jgi:hypothetical protein